MLVVVPIAGALGSHGDVSTVSQAPAAESTKTEQHVGHESEAEAAPAEEQTTETAPTSAEPSALALLATLPIKGRAPKTGYERTGMYGQAWIDVDANGCDTRNDILRRDLTDLTMRNTCTVATGTLNDPYTGTTINFVRGNDSSMAVQIDHVVALMNSWETGAQQLTQEQRIALANDPLNLLAVDGPTNQQKGAGDAATWLPPAKAFRCDYVSRQVSVKARYSLWVTQAEHDAIERVLATCPDAKGTPSAPAPTAEPTAAAAAPAPVAAVSVAPVYFDNCTAARLAGAAPVRIGDPGYGRHLDRDGDGVGCE